MRTRTALLGIRGLKAALLFCGALLLVSCSSAKRGPGSADLARGKAFQMNRAAQGAAGSGDVKGSIDWTSAGSSSSWKTRGADEIAPGFKLRIENPDDAEVRGQFTVAHNGMLKLPYDVQVKAEGLTPDKLAQELNGSYSRFLTRPRFKVSVDEKRYSVDVRGLVEKPGPYIVDAESSLDDLIAQAGGLQTNDDSSRKARYARVSQLGVSKLINLQDYYSGTQGLLPRWQGGETGFFQAEGSEQFSMDRDYIQVLGQVSSPGAYPYRKASAFVSYLTLAGGPTSRADLDRITLLRRDEGGITERELALSDITGDDLDIRAGDTLIIQADNRTGVERSSTIAAGFAAVVSAIGLLAIGL